MQGHILGIDMAKSTFDVALYQDNNKVKTKKFSNNREGFTALTTWLLSHGINHAHACMYVGDAAMYANCAKYGKDLIWLSMVPDNIVLAKSLLLKQNVDWIALDNGYKMYPIHQIDLFQIINNFNIFSYH